MLKTKAVRKPSQHNKLRALTPHQRRTLRRWLVVENLPYPKARARLLDKFGIQMSAGTLWRFWDQYCAKREPAAPRSGPLLDITIQSVRPVRVRILECRARVRFKVGTQKQLRRAFLVKPDGVEKLMPARNP